MGDIRKPIKQSAIEKKQRIILGNKIDTINDLDIYLFSFNGLGSIFKSSNKLVSIITPP